MSRIKKLLLKILSRFRSLKTYQKILSVLAVLFLLVILYLVPALLLVSKNEIKLAELERSYQEDNLCREDCLKKRLEITAALVDELKKRPDARLARRIKKYFFDSEVKRDFKNSLVVILQQALGSEAPPDYLIGYLDDQDSDPYIAAKIIAKFSPQSLSSVKSNQTSAGQLQYYFDILQSDSEYPLKIAAIRQISNNASTPGAYTLEQLKMISAWLLDDENSNKIKYHLIMLSGDYYSLFPEETLEVFRTIYWAAGSSNLSRALAADFLNRLEPDGGPDGANWEIVEVSPEEWADYYSD